MKITEQMVNDFNDSLYIMDTCFKLEYEEWEDNPQCKIVPSSNTFVNSAIINLTDEFYKILEGFFRKRGIELHYNNTRSIFWSARGWDD